METEQEQQEQPPVPVRNDYPKCAADTELYYLIRARYNLIYVVTWEESRVVRSLEQICEMDDVKLSGVQVWDAARGLLTRTANGEQYCPVEEGEEVKEPEEILSYIIAKAEENKGKTLKAKASRGPIYVLHDFFRFLEEPKPETERKLRVLSSILKKSTISVVITSPELQLPLPLEKVVTVMDYPLPGPDQIIVLVQAAKKKLVLLNKMTQANADSVPDENVVKALLGLTMQEAEDALSKAYVMTKKFDTKILCDLKRQIIRKGQILDYVYSEEKVDDIGGLAGIKQWIKTRKTAFMDRARTYPLPYPKGVFLLGVQGTGKSLCAKVIANELGVPLLKLDLGKVFAPHIGESEGNIRRALKLAESIAPCVLFVDEIDMAFSGSTNSNNLDSGVSSRVVTTIMDWMQERTSPVFVVACANSSNMPAALLRKGRFDERFFVDLPNEEERAAIFNIHLKKRNRRPEVFDIDKLVGVTKGYSGAEIEAIVVDGMTEAFADNERDVITKDLLDQVAISYPLSKTMKPQIDAVREKAVTMRSASVIPNQKPDVGDEDDLRTES